MRHIECARSFTGCSSNRCVNGTIPVTETVTAKVEIDGLLLFTSSFTDGFEPGFVRNEFYINGPISTGTHHQLVATVDPDNQIAEQDETNNTTTFFVYLFDGDDVPTSASQPIGTITDTSPLFSWLKVPESHRYWLQVRPKTGTMFFEAVTDDATTAFQGPVLPSGCYDWRVKALNTFSEGAWSPWFSFCIE